MDLDLLSVNFLRETLPRQIEEEEERVLQATMPEDRREAEKLGRSLSQYYILLNLLHSKV